MKYDQLPALALCLSLTLAMAFASGVVAAQTTVNATPQASSTVKHAKLKPADTANLVSHLRRMITGEANDTPPRVLNAFVAKYQQRALDAGIDNLGRQTQYVLLALYTSGKAMEQPLFIALMKNPPASLDAFYYALQALLKTVWEAGLPLWEAYEPKG